MFSDDEISSKFSFIKLFYNKREQRSRSLKSTEKSWSISYWQRQTSMKLFAFSYLCLHGIWRLGLRKDLRICHTRSAPGQHLRTLLLGRTLYWEQSNISSLHSRSFLMRILPKDTGSPSCPMCLLWVSRTTIVSDLDYRIQETSAVCCEHDWDFSAVILRSGCQGWSSFPMNHSPQINILG